MNEKQNNVVKFTVYSVFKEAKRNDENFLTYDYTYTNPVEYIDINFTVDTIGSKDEDK